MRYYVTPSVPLVLMTSRVDVILLVVGSLHMTSRFSLLAPYPTERLDVILHQNYDGEDQSFQLGLRVKVLWLVYYTGIQKKQMYILHIKIKDTMSIGSSRRFGGLASIFMGDQKSSGETSSKALRPVLGLWPPHCWGFDTVEFLREEDGRLTPILQCGRTGYPTLSDMGDPTSS
jgi:hypothetical protein